MEKKLSSKLASIKCAARQGMTMSHILQKLDRRIYPPYKMHKRHIPRTSPKGI